MEIIVKPEAVPVLKEKVASLQSKTGYRVIAEPGG